MKKDSMEMVYKIILESQKESAKTKRAKTNIDLWLKLTLIELQFPFDNYESALKCIEEIYQLSPDYLDALILETEIHWHYLIITEDLAKRLEEAIAICDCDEKNQCYIISYPYNILQKKILKRKKSILKNRFNYRINMYIHINGWDIYY